MPPYMPRKRLRSVSPGDIPDRDVKGSAKRPRVTSLGKTTLFEALDATSTPGKPNTSTQGLDESDSSLTSLSDSEFEPVKPKGSKPPRGKRKGREASVDDVNEDDSDEDIVFEDVPTGADTRETPHAPPVLKDLQLDLTKDTRISLDNNLGKRGPTKLERKVRVATHCLHVMCLLWHNALRNAWISDPLVQGIMLSHVPPRLWDDIDRWRRASALEEPPPPPARATKSKGKKKKDMAKAEPTEARDWGDAAQRLEPGVPDLSHGDPLFKLAKALTAWWKKTFKVTAPGLRKVGYMSLERLDKLRKAWKEEDGQDAERFGERFAGLEEFRRSAQDCTGSRDVGAQLFTALLRALGLESRMVASLQPLGFGWSKGEEADPEKELKEKTSTPDEKKKAPAKISQKAKGKAPAESQKRSRRRSSRLGSDELMTDKDEDDLDDEESDDDSDVEIDQTEQKETKYDKDLQFPHYWTEILSPITKHFLAVDPLIKSVIATKRDYVEMLEPRGAKADKAKQIIAYVVAYSPDGTAKDVTVRYLKKQLYPGRTKGTRMPIEKVPVYNKDGKVKRYEQFDWFKSAMRGYIRGDEKHPLTEADHEEDATDLRPAQVEKKEVKEGDETMQYYKQSKEFVLERHLKREEALLPTTKPVKIFKNKSKGSETGEPVFLRKDVVQVKSAETWHKQGREPKAGAQPLKRVPYRAATTNRRRALAEAEAATGEKVLQGLYSLDQTDWIIPEPIKDGMIPKNDYGNIDLFVETMCPRGAVHVPFRGAVKVCKRMGIDYAEAVVDFEFGHRMAVPVIQGVVIAEEHHDAVMEGVVKEEAERARKEDAKRTQKALNLWRRFLMGMRVMERIRKDYGDIEADVPPSEHRADADGYVDTGGGFLPEGFELAEQEERPAQQTSAYFQTADHDEDGGDVGGEDPLEVDLDGAIAPSGFLAAVQHNKDEQHEQKNDVGETPVRTKAASRANGKRSKSKPMATAKAKTQPPKRKNTASGTKTRASARVRARAPRAQVSTSEGGEDDCTSEDFEYHDGEEEEEEDED